MTILVALMLLVLLTIAAMAMARNSLREIATTGFSRQGAMARNVADSGLEWSIHWLDVENGKLAPSDNAAEKLTQLKATLLQDLTLAGVARDLASPSSPVVYAPGRTVLLGQSLSHISGATQGFTLGLTYMGKLPVAGMSQGAGSGAFTPAAGGQALQAPDLWAIRSDAQVVQGGVTFIHGKELWVSTPVR